MNSFVRFTEYPEHLATVIAFDPGGTTGFCIMGTYPDALDKKDQPPLYECLDYVDYGTIDCGTQKGETGVGVRRGHDGLNLPGENDGIIQMVNLVEEHPHAVIVLEDFVLDVAKANSGRDLLTPVRIISGFTGLLHYCFGPQELNRIFIQNRSLAKTTCTDDRLKNWGLYDRSSGPHARDAVRHAYYFLRSCRGDGIDAGTKRHLAWHHLFDDPEVREPKVPEKAPPKQGERVNFFRQP